MPQLGKRAELFPTFRFSVEVEGLGKAAFTECTMTGWELDYEELKEGGQNYYRHKLIGAVKEGAKVTLKRGLVDSMLIRWLSMAMDGDLNNAMKSVTVILANSTGKPAFTWTFDRAYPVKWEGPALNAGESVVAMETLEFVYHQFGVVIGEQK